MGIRGLTTFIQNRSHLYMEKYELYDTSLVLDGYAVACQLYKWHSLSNDCFGGDYDKFANVVSKFFQLLADCNITPYVVFDGGYENRKIATVISRMKNRIKSADQLNGVTEGSISVFPLLLRLTFLEVVIKLNIKRVRCDFEGDSETASIARTLNCPVLSYDSDFFIFDVLYIPFNTFEMCVRKGKLKNNESYKFIPCEVYRVENFLKSYTGLEKSSLPILAVLLGNDYVKRSVFALFYQNLKMQKSGSSQNEGQRRIKSLIVWLQNESIETAIKKVLGRFKKDKRRYILGKIENAIQGYHSTDSKYLGYLGLKSIVPDDRVTNTIFSDNIVSDQSEDEESDCKTEEDDSSCDEALQEEQEPVREEEETLKMPPIFLEKFRHCLYPPSFMNILLHHKYYCPPQVENSALPHSHVVSFDILAAIYKILTGSNIPLICIGRIENEQVGKREIPPCDIDLPTLAEIQDMTVDRRKQVLLEVLRVDESILATLTTFPDSWQLFILALRYLMGRTKLGKPLVYSLLLSRMILNCVDEKIGFYRSVKEFNKKFGPGPETADDNSTLVLANSISQALEDIEYKDCKTCMKTLISYFEMNHESMTIRSFDRNLVHSISQFQSCLLHVGQLNSLLNFPYQKFLVAECLNCTFVYNLTKNFNKRTNLDEYVSSLLQNSPTVLHSYRLITEKVKDFASENVVIEEVKPKRRRKKRKKGTSVEEADEVLPETDEEILLDPCNKFALLSIATED